MSIPTDDDTKREIVFPTFRPVYNGVSGERRTAGETQYERRIVGKQQVYIYIYIYLNVQAVSNNFKSIIITFL